MTSTNTPKKIRFTSACRLLLPYLASALLGFVAGTLLGAAFFVSDPSGFMLLFLAGLFIFTRIPVVAYRLVPAVAKAREIELWAQKDRAGRYLLMFIWIALGLISGGILNYVRLNILRKDGALL